MNRETVGMQEKHTIQNRREFMKDGLRIVMVSGFAFMGLFLGRRGYSCFGKKSSCSVDLPCGSCPELSGCRQPRAIDTRHRTKDSRE